MKIIKQKLKGIKLLNSRVKEELFTGQLNLMERKQIQREGRQNSEMICTFN